MFLHDTSKMLLSLDFFFFFFQFGSCSLASNVSFDYLVSM